MSYKIFFRSDFKLKDIGIKYQDNQGDIKIDLFSEDIGSNVFLYLNNKNVDNGGLILDNNYIIKLKLENNKFYPTINVVFKDPNKIVGNWLYPDDDTILSFFKKSYSNLLMPIRIDFVITEFRIVKELSDETATIYSLNAMLNFNNITENIAYNGTSFSVLQQIAKKAKLGFASNINNTNDKMVWINPGNYLSEFIPDIVKNSYKDDGSFLWTFIDLYYNLNYVNVEDQLNQNTFEQKNIFNFLRYDKSGKEKISDLLLTNHPNLIGSNMYFDKYIATNNSRDINWKIGYESDIYYYNRSENSVVKNKLNTISDSYDSNNMSMQSLNKSDNNRRYHMGKMDEDNVHANFLDARKQNENNIEFLQKIKMNIILESPNMSLYRSQFVEVIIYDLNTLITEKKTDLNKTDSYRINDKLSGSWLISGINFVYEKGKSYQEITLVKRKLNKEYDKEKLDDITKYFYKNK